MTTIWNKWEPKVGLKNKYYVDKVSEDEEKGLLIELSDEEGTKMIINWDGIVESYTCTEESSRSVLYDNTEITSWTFFQVENSQYLQWICEQSLGIQQSENLHHFCIIGINSVVDIIAGYNPDVIVCE